jgi:hypothetical protein
MPPGAFDTAPPSLILPDNVFALEGLNLYRAITKAADKHEVDTQQWLLARDAAAGIFAPDAFAPVPVFPFPKHLDEALTDARLDRENEQWRHRVEQWVLDRDWFLQEKSKPLPRHRNIDSSVSAPPPPSRISVREADVAKKW